MGRRKLVKGLLDIIGKGYKVSFDEAWKHESAEEKMPNRIWYEQINLKGGGFLSLYDLTGKILKVWTPRYKLAREVADLDPKIKLVTMDKEAELFFPFELAPMILKKMQGQKRRTMSEENKAKAAERFAKYRASKSAQE